MRNKLVKPYVLTILGMVVGAVGGYLYWRYVGCSTGTYPITASPLYSTLWGAIMGGLLFNIYNKKDKTEDQ